jgi:hypothetical protein
VCTQQSIYQTPTQFNSTLAVVSYIRTSME